MTAAPDYLGTLRGALSDWLYDPRYTTAPYEAQAAHANAIEAALTECRREGLGDVADDLSRGHGWEDTAASWVWRLPRWDDNLSSILDEFEIEDFMNIKFEKDLRCSWNFGNIRIDWWSRDFRASCDRKWTILELEVRVGTGVSLKSPEGLALLDTARPTLKVTP